MEFDLSNMSDDVKLLNPELAKLEIKKPSKYRNVRASMDGMSFDSGKEATDARAYMVGVKNGVWIAYLHHVRFPLAGGTYYEADHVLINNDLTVSVCDSKGGIRTKEYRLKKKLFEERYHKEITEI